MAETEASTDAGKVRPNHKEMGKLVKHKGIGELALHSRPTLRLL